MEASSAERANGSPPTPAPSDAALPQVRPDFALADRIHPTHHRVESTASSATARAANTTGRLVRDDSPRSSIDFADSGVRGGGPREGRKKTGRRERGGKDRSKMATREMEGPRRGSGGESDKGGGGGGESIPQRQQQRRSSSGDQVRSGQSHNPTLITDLQQHAPPGSDSGARGYPSSADAAAVGIDPGVGPGIDPSLAPSSRQRDRQRALNLKHRRNQTMPELQLRQQYAFQQQAAAAAAAYGQYGAAQNHHPQPGAAAAPSAAQDPQLRGAGPSMPRDQFSPDIADGGGDERQQQQRGGRDQRRNRRHQKTLSEPSGKLFQNVPPPGGAGASSHMRGVEALQSPTQRFSPNVWPPEGGRRLSGDMSSGFPLPRNRSLSERPYSHGDRSVYWRGGSGGEGGGGPVIPLETFSPKRELLALTKGLSPSQRRLAAQQLQGIILPSDPPMSPGRSSRAAPLQPQKQPTTPTCAQADVGGLRGLSPLHEHIRSSDVDLRIPHILTPLRSDQVSPHNGGMTYSFPPITMYGSNESIRPNINPEDGWGASDCALMTPGSGRNSSHSRKTSSTRKMHMRQHSVQTFMNDVRGEPQPRRCRDAIFAALFLLQIAVMVAIGVKYGPEALRQTEEELGEFVEDNGTDGTGTLRISYRNVIAVACLCGFFAATLSAVALAVMTVIARRLVQVALIFSIVMAFAWGTLGIGLSPQSIVPITGTIALACIMGYTFVVWDRIPFASANLVTALNGIRDNLALVVITFAFQALALWWSIFYTFSVLGIYDAIENGDIHVKTKTGKVLVYTVLGISYYWTFQVIENTVKSVVAGTMGVWWSTPEEKMEHKGAKGVILCSGPMRDSLLRSTVLSFGSICFGSLFVGFIQVLRQFAENFRPNREARALMCLQECLLCFQECALGCVDTLADSFQPWAFTFVGMYGYDFLEAGRGSTELFRKRGWKTIVTDDLIPNVLFIASLVIGGVTGCFGLLIEAVDGFNFTNLHNPATTAFLIGAVVGLVLSSVLFSVISSSVCAVIVCFAGNPVEFQKNHPKLSDEMRSAWREVWPGCMDVHDLTLSISGHAMSVRGGSTPALALGGLV